MMKRRREDTTYAGLKNVDIIPEKNWCYAAKRGMLNSPDESDGAMPQKKKKMIERRKR